MSTVNNFDSKKRVNEESKVIANYNIKAKNVRVIDNQGEQLGVMGLEQALALAKEAQLDLVEISGKSDPKVCKIISLSKYKYQIDIKKKDIKKNTLKSEVKEIKLRPMIDEHDLKVKIKQIEKFINQNNKVKVTVQLNGREIGRPEQAVKLISRISSALEVIVTIDSGPNTAGKFVTVVYSKKK